MGIDGRAAERRLYRLWGELRDIAAAEELLVWDQETQMPAKAQPDRGQVLATLAGLKHRKLVDPELQEALAECGRAAADAPALAAQLRAAHHQVDRAVRTPETLARALAAAKSAGTAAWLRARAESDFRIFEPHLRELVRLRGEEARAVAPELTPYDALLDEFEPGIRQGELEPLFSRLRHELAGLVQAAGESGQVVDESAARGHFPAEAQRAFGLGILAAIGFDLDAGRVDPSAHPFATGIHPTDVRLTWRWQEEDFRPGLFGLLHEGGHGLYEQGLPREHRRTPLGDLLSLGLHESQSRLWENHVGRSRGFWRWALPRFRESFPDSADTSIDDLWPALHAVRPSTIRVEADEVTYNLHVIVRFELEKALFAEDLDVAELPGAWRDRYRDVLGVIPDGDHDGVLQDIHWSQGMFGYFPTYTLGNLAAAQLFDAAARELGDLEAAFADGDFGSLLAWLRDRIHRHGATFRFHELVAEATGAPPTIEPLLARLRLVCG